MVDLTVLFGIWYRKVGKEKSLKRCVFFIKDSCIGHKKNSQVCIEASTRPAQGPQILDMHTFVT